MKMIFDPSALAPRPVPPQPRKRKVITSLPPVTFAIGKMGLAYPLLRETARHAVLDHPDGELVIPLTAIARRVEKGSTVKLKNTRSFFKLEGVFDHLFGTQDNGQRDVESWAILKDRSGRISKWKISQLEFI
jgi:hypothetical protein